MPRVFPVVNENSILPASDSRSTPSGGGSSSVVSLEAQAPIGSGTITDPSSIATSYLTSGLFTRITLQSPSTVSRLPNLGARFGTASVDVFGTTNTLMLGDIFQLMLWSEDAAPPSTDLIIWAAMTVGNVSATSFGIAVGLENASGVWRVQHAINTGTSWAWTNASSTSGTTRGAILQAIIGTDDSQARINAWGIDASGAPVGQANSPSSPGTMTGWTVFPDTLSWGAGWATGVGGSAGAVAKLSPRLILQKRANVENTVL